MSELGIKGGQFERIGGGNGEIKVKKGEFCEEFKVFGRDLIGQ